jgi:hypothetical protein
MPRQAQLALVPEGTMDRTPQPIVADCVDPLGPHMRQQAPDERMGGQGHGLPTLVLGVLVAEAPLPISDGAEAVVGQREAVARPAQVLQDWLRAWRGRFTGDAPPCGPDPLGKGQVGAFLTHQIEQQPAKALREGLDGHQVGRAGGPPLGPVGGAPAGWPQTVHMWRLDAGPGPGVEDAEHATEPPDILGVCRERDARGGRGAEHKVVQVVLVAADQRPQLVGPGQDHMTGGDRESCRAPVCQPGFGVEALTRGAAAVAAGVVDIVFLTPGLAWHQRPAQGLGPAVDQIIQSAAMAGPESRANPLLLGEPIAPEDVRHLWHARPPER